MIMRSGSMLARPDELKETSLMILVQTIKLKKKEKKKKKKEKQKQTNWS